MTHRIVSLNGIYPSYPIENLTSDIDIIRRFQYGRLPERNIGVNVIHVFKEAEVYDACIVEDSQNKVYIIEKKGLEKIENLLPCRLCGGMPYYSNKDSIVSFMCFLGNHEKIEVKGFYKEAVETWNKLNEVDE